MSKRFALAKYEGEFRRLNARFGWRISVEDREAALANLIGFASII